MGASSVRFAHGRFVDGMIQFEIVRQVPNKPEGRCWDLRLLLGFCKEAVSYAKEHDASVGIDSWGVDHAFLDKDDKPVCGPVMYRDPSHLAMSERMANHREGLFRLTGIAHQPFNTLYQLAARKEEDPSLPERSEWYLMPDLMTCLLTGVRKHEQSQASTTQLMGTDGTWSEEAFDLIGWPVPTRQPSASGTVTGFCEGVPLTAVASHDTASAVVGTGRLPQGTAYLNVGTWALLGVVLSEPCTSAAALRGNWTNEWAHDGTIRFLKNIPGFYVINRLFDELNPARDISSWLRSRDLAFDGRFDPHHPELYNPDSMTRAVASVCSKEPRTPGEFATAALASLVETVARDLPSLEETSGPISRLRIVGGGSKSPEFCQALADVTKRSVQASEASEATVLGNLALQFVATGEIPASEVPAVVERSVGQRYYEPGAGP